MERRGAVAVAELAAAALTPAPQAVGARRRAGVLQATAALVTAFRPRTLMGWG